MSTGISQLAALGMYRQSGIITDDASMRWANESLMDIPQVAEGYWDIDDVRKDIAVLQCIIEN